MDIEYEVNNYDQLAGAMNVAQVVFNPNEEEQAKYHRKEQWEERARSGALVTASNNGTLVEFVVCYPNESKFHIWNVGVLPEYRGQKIWQTMYTLVVEYANKNNFESITLNTFPEKFTNMYRFVINNGFVEIKREIDSANGDAKVFMGKKLLLNKSE